MGNETDKQEEMIVEIDGKKVHAVISERWRDEHGRFNKKPEKD